MIKRKIAAGTLTFLQLPLAMFGWLNLKEENSEWELANVFIGTHFLV
jgi:hypothetical protein